MKLISVLCPHCQKSVSISPQSLSNTVQCEHCNKPVLDGKPIEADVGNFDMLIKGPKPVVVTFWGANCSPCNSFKSIFEKVASEKKKQLRFLRVNVQRNKALASRYRIRSVPTLMVFKKGKQQSVLNTALRKKEFVDWLNDALNS